MQRKNTKKKNEASSTKPSVEEKKEQTKLPIPNLNELADTLWLGAQYTKNAAVNLKEKWEAAKFENNKWRNAYDEDKKTSRDTTTFNANVTASLALPSDKPEIKQLQRKSETPSLGESIYRFALSFVERKKIIDEPSEELKRCDLPINQKIEQIETAVKLAGDNQTIDKLSLKKINLLENEIIEHAARRVDLFFYLLVAVYKKWITVDREGAEKQNGRGASKYGTHACHSSLFTKVRFERIPQKAAWFFSPPLCPSLEGTQFDEALNMTTELPKWVNWFDKHLEGFSETSKHVKRCEKIIASVTRGEIDPIEGLNQFLQIMQRFFNTFERKYIKIEEVNESNTRKKHKKEDEQDQEMKALPLQLPETYKRIWELEKKGTFVCADENLQVKPEYVYTLLRIPEKERMKVNYLPSMISGYNAYLHEIQNEIFSSQCVSVKKNQCK